MGTATLIASIHDLSGHSAVLDGAMRGVAEEGVYGVLVVLAALWVHRAGLRAGLAAAIGAAVALGIGALASGLWAEPRPFVAGHFTPLVAHTADASFPSDHLLVLGALAGACFGASRWLGLVASALAFAVALARVYVGLHYPVDVAAGFVIGLVCGGAAFQLTRLAQPGLRLLDGRLQRWHLRPVLIGASEDTDEKA